MPHRTPDSDSNDERAHNARKRTRRDLKEALQTLQSEMQEMRLKNRTQQEQIREQDSEIIALKDQLQAAAQNDNAPTTSRRRRRRRQAASDAGLATLAAREGRKFAVTKCMWVPPSIFDESQELEGDDFDDQTATIASDLRTFLDQRLLPHWSDSWFQSEFKVGVGNVRSKFVAELVLIFPKIFGGVERGADYTNRNSRKDLDVSKTQLQDYAFLYASDGNRVEGFLRSQPMLKGMKALLTGLSSAVNGVKSSKSRSNNLALWGIKSINNQMLAFVATSLYFVLSCAETFSESSGAFDFSGFYRARLQLLEEMEGNRPRAYDALISYYNRIFFPSAFTTPEDNEDTRLDASDRALLTLFKQQEAEHLESVTIGSQAHD
ncbi:hypothetical protein BOTBODRAFT_192863 [Botryobasidium botryosum FD-172 SS1]|uniref:Uncharacterized protein n=1 Tax=Botryobasidium botryosum (strain FD-172 SS1) TaxID=930990 RepID=A0A067LWT5_BOTB1|nr:hypothetical protein BOTBODRAFT_192863 [Botryobasidium botryosum FD-172 SS1]